MKSGVKLQKHFQKAQARCHLAVVWLPGHRGISDNCVSNELARGGITHVAYVYLSTVELLLNLTFNKIAKSLGQCWMLKNQGM